MSSLGLLTPDVGTAGLQHMGSALEDSPPPDPMTAAPSGDWLKLCSARVLLA